jgi:alpha-1,3-glucan synthase
VEFGRKGALGVGARVGGLGQMPGFWYTVESTSTSALLSQFRQAIDESLACKYDTRAMMRARSNLQRFPVAQWVEDLEILQSTAIRIHEKVKAQKAAGGFLSLPASAAGSGATTPRNAHSRSSSYVSLAKLGARIKNRTTASSRPSTEAAAPANGLSRSTSLGSRRGPGHIVAEDLHDGPVERSILAPIPDMESRPDISSGPTAENQGYDSDVDSLLEGDDDEPTLSMRRHGPRLALAPHGGAMTPPLSSRPRFTLDLDNPQPSTPGTPDLSDGLLRPPPSLLADESRQHKTLSMLSVDSVVGEKHDFFLQKVDPFFTDSRGEYQETFNKKLEALNASNSTTSNSIEDFLIKSEKDWFTKYRDAKLGRYHPNSSRSSLTLAGESRPVSLFEREEERNSSENSSLNDQFLLPQDYKPPTGINKWLQLRIGDWPVYAFLLGLGQIISANSYQITLLTGEVGQTASKLYVIASIYLATSIMWWICFRRFASRVTLSLPWLFYGLAFVLIGTAHYGGTHRGWIQNIGTAFYAIASSSGSIFFALNFGDEGGAQVKAWVFRACVIQGTQQIYIAALWYWGSVLTKRFQDGILTAADPVSSTWKITAITLPIAILLWSIGLILYFGLPNYYRQQPGKMPSFYRSLTRRKIVLWFFVTVLIQNFFLSAPYGRNWTFLWSSRHTQTWQIILLILAFFVGVWALFLWLFGWLSKSHSWILPLFAIGLGAPRWAQIWWGTSNIGLWLPWAGGFTSSALVSRALWLWLGTLDAIQGVGLGMILLGTLTRVHVAFTLISAQVLGSIATIVARAVAPNKIGPGPISPDVSGGVGSLWQAWFWVGLAANLLVCVGFYKFYRKEQLTKP